MNLNNFKIQKHLLKIAYAQLESSINSHFFLIISAIVQILAIITLVDVQDTHQVAFSKFISTIMIQLHEHFYFYQHFIVENYRVVNLAMTVSCLCFEIILIFYLFKLSQSNPNHNIIKIITIIMRYLKLTLNTPAFILNASILRQSWLISDYFTCILSFLTLLVSSASEFFLEQFNFTCLYKPRFVSDRLYNYFEARLELLRKVLLIYIAFIPTLNDTETITVNIILIVMAAIKLIKILESKVAYFDEIYEFTLYFKQIFIIGYYMMYILAFYVPLLKQNMIFAFITIIIFSSYAFYNYLTTIRYNLLIKNVKEIHSETESITYMRLLYKTYLNLNQIQDNLIFTGILRNHKNACEQTECYCRYIENLKIPKNEDDDEQMYLLKYFQGCFRELMKNNVGNNHIEKSLLAFNVEVMKEFPKYYYSIESIRQKNKIDLTMVQEFGFLQLQKQTQKIYNARLQYRNSPIAHKLLEHEQKLMDLYHHCELLTQNFNHIYDINTKTQCDLNYLEKQFQKTSPIMHQIQKYIDNIIYENMTAFQLINLALFYSTHIVNTHNTYHKLQERLKFVLSKLEFKEIRDINFNVNLYIESGCVIGSTVEHQKFGCLTSISSNAAKIFNYPRNDLLIGLDVNKLLLPCVRDEHSRLMQNWVDSGHFKFQREGMINTYYCYDFHEYVFRCMTKFQILVTESRLMVYKSILKRQDQNLIVVSKNNKIDAYTKNIQQIFGQQLKRSSIDKFIQMQAWQQIANKLENEKKIYTNVQIMKKYKEPAVRRQRRLGRSRDQITREFSLITPDKIKIIDKKLRNEVKLPQQTDQYSERRKKVSIRQLKSNSKQFYEQKQQPKLYADIIVTKQKFSQQYFYVIQIQELHNKEELTSQKSLHTNVYQSYRHSTIIKPLMIKHKESSSNNLPVTKNNEKYTNILEKSSISSSTTYDDQYSIKRIIKMLEQKMTQGYKINNKSLKIVSVILIGIALSFVLVSFAELHFYKNGLFSFATVIGAGSSVSNNFQLLEIMYNQVHMISQNCDGIFDNETNSPNSNVNSDLQSNCQYILQQTKHIYSILYPIMYTNVQYLIKNKTYLNHLYFSYELEPVEIDLNGVKVEVLNYQYMEYFIGLVKRIMGIVKGEYSITLDSGLNMGQYAYTLLHNDEYNQLVKILKANWPKLVQLNHKNIILYEKISHDELTTVKIFTLIMLSLEILLILLFFYSFSKYYSLDNQLMLKILILFRHIPTKISQQLTQKYQTISNLLHKAKWPLISRYIHAMAAKNQRSLWKTQLQFLDTGDYRELSYTYSYPAKAKIFAILLMIWMVVIEVIKVQEMTNFYNACYDINGNISNLMNSENYLLEAYFTYKNYYLFNINTHGIEKFEENQAQLQDIYRKMIKELKEKVSQHEIDFIKYSLQALTLLKGTSAQYVTQFQKIVIDSICQFQLSNFHAYETQFHSFQNCRQAVSYRINEQGILMGMNYFQRIVQDKFNLLQNLTISSNQSQIVSNELKQAIFRDTDSQLIYMFEMYEKIQIKIIEGLENSINKKRQTLIIMNSENTLYIVLILIYWFAKYRSECEKLSQKFGYLMCYPGEVMKTVRRNIVQILQT